MLAGLSVRITIVLCVLLSAAVALVAALSLSKYRETLQRVVENRFSYVLQDVVRTGTLGLDLQLPLAEITSLQSTLERARGEHPDLRYIEIFDAEGRILFSTDPTTLGDALPDAWIYQNAGNERGLWRRSDEGDLVLGQAVRSRLDQVVGGVVLAYTGAVIESSVAGMRQRLIEIGAIVVPGFTIALIAVLWALLHDSQRRLGALARWLEGAPGADEPPDIGGTVRRAARGTREAFEAVAEGKRELELLEKRP